ncbi:hypothetical protein NPIL_247971 [Nephila pilipes]|uniref:Uncharacterized protein n=1 Tax=Nephila pilipes TaxID=299642 RepID=A0A8X6TCU5_NEPPI|nr:hypothetical protein NPIL_247971 [Nephila pilipes]
MLGKNLPLPFYPHLKTKKVRKNKRNLVPSTLVEKRIRKKSKCVIISDNLDNDSESMLSFPSSSKRESEREIGVSKVTLPQAFVLSKDIHESGLEDEEGFTVVHRMKRVSIIFIDDNLNTPELSKELSEVSLV